MSKNLTTSKNCHMVKMNFFSSGHFINYKILCSEITFDHNNEKYIMKYKDSKMTLMSVKDYEQYLYKDLVVDKVCNDQSNKSSGKVEVDDNLLYEDFTTKMQKVVFKNEIENEKVDKDIKGELDDIYEDDDDVFNFSEMLKHQSVPNYLINKISPDLNTLK